MLTILKEYLKSLFFNRVIGERVKSRQYDGAEQLDNTPDTPVSFGYKNMWFAFKTEDSDSIIETLGITNARKANWRSGIKYAYSWGIYITPPIDGWTLITGMGLPSGDYDQSIQLIKQILSHFSKKCGEAQFFCTQRIVDFHCWYRFRDGNPVRMYAWLGEGMENIVVEGPPSSFEKSKNYVNIFAQDSQAPGYWERDDVTMPSEDDVMLIAEKWSVNPSTLSERAVSKGTGYAVLDKPNWSKIASRLL